ncbi:MAG: MBL fold metallo-hydrolase [Microcella sp.]|uniref:MBL fold metallo-hydrolase n=1 Tax=Microcella sp. TaxID=1913979 RepID=UPI0033160D1A
MTQPQKPTSRSSIVESYLTQTPLLSSSQLTGDDGFDHGRERDVVAPAAWLLGTGTPKVLPHRSGPANYLQLGAQRVLVDCGVGTTQRLVSLGAEPADITHIFITHHHLDHNAELASLLLSPWVDRLRDTCPVVVGPPGTAAFVDRLLGAFDYDVRTRQSLGYDLSLVRPRVVEVHDGLHVAVDTWSFTAFRVDHEPVDEAFGYRFDWQGGSVAFSGDTAPCDNLVEYCRGVDVLVHEALFPGYGIPRYHTTVDQVGAVATASGARHLVLTHLLPGHLPDEVWRHRIATAFDGPITVGSDLLRVW